MQFKREHNGKIKIPAPLLLLFGMSFTVWQMGIIYFAGTTMSLFGRTPIRLSNEDTTFVILAGYLISILMICLAPRMIIKIQRVLLPLALAASVALFFVQSTKVTTYLFYMIAFICVCSIGNLASLAVHTFTPETILYDGILCVIFGGSLIAFLQNDFIPINFTTFNAVAVLLVIGLTVFHYLIPGNINCSYVSRKNPMKMPKILVGGLWLMIIFSTLLVCFANSYAESVTHGVSVLYLSGALFGLVLVAIRKQFHEKAIRVCGIFFVIAVFAFVLAFPAIHINILSLIVCGLMGVIVVLANLWIFFISVSFQFYPSRFVGAMGAAVGMVLAMMHTGMLQAFHDNLTLLYGVYAVVAVAMMVIYYLAEPYYLEAWKSIQKKARTKIQFEKLSEQEENLANLILQGYTESQIAMMMNISINTQKSYRKNLYTKLNIHSKRELFELSEKE